MICALAGRLQVRGAGQGCSGRTTSQMQVSTSRGTSVSLSFLIRNVDHPSLAIFANAIFANTHNAKVVC